MCMILQIMPTFLHLRSLDKDQLFILYLKMTTNLFPSSLHFDKVYQGVYLLNLEPVDE